MSADAAPPSLIEYYYDCFNSRRFADAAALFSEGHIEFSPGAPWSGPDGYLHFAEAWTSAFPNVTFNVESVAWRSATVCEVYLRAKGTHTGEFRFGRYRIPPTDREAILHLRELLDIHDGRIRASMVTIEFSDLVRELAQVDYDDVVARVERVCRLRDELKAARGEHRRDVLDRLGAELDAARRALRPHFGW
ncbi:MAG TPA: ester cyclase [Vicinamibacterales bacterium]|nr:ester cyclase [Vicinamibacterales bacterium]